MDKIKKLIKEKDLIIFDFDGVLINSKTNMKKAWLYACKHNGLHVPFANYFKHIGLPFRKILINLKINLKRKKYSKIKSDFSKKSLNEIKKIKLYKDVKLVLNKLKKKGKLIALLTSKDYPRSIAIIKNLKLNFDHIECGTEKKRGKPNPLQLNLILKKFKKKKNKAIYIGDMKPDLITAKNAKVDFILAKYGYANFKSKQICYQINNIKNLI